MSKVSKPASAYSAMAAAAASRSSLRPPRSMSATCHNPVTMRLISRFGASRRRSGLAGGIVAPFIASSRPKQESPPPSRGEGTLHPLLLAQAAGSIWSEGRSVSDLLLDGVDVGGGHLADRRDLAVLDAPQAERAGDVAIGVEG